MQLSLIAAAIALAAYAAVLAWMYLRQESLLFYPAPLAADQAFAIPDVHEVWIDVDGATLSALHLTLPDPKGVVFFLHGNAGNLASWFTGSTFYRQANFDLFMIDYRGYGKSSGRIGSERELHADVRKAWDRVAALYAGKRIVIYGRSLGTALAAHLAAEVQPDLTILVSPFWSAQDLARIHFPWVPAALLRYPLAMNVDLRAIRTPVMLVHGERDPLIPVDQSERLLEVAPNGVLLRVRGAGHNDVHEFGEYLDAVARRLREL
ncbi:MAG TPA: alpha/beta fold hydrolase [Casimicrobiaceae bacterium]|nr:alpha/beta fold hydrolase [Casimicrobiaceae bacterium]